VNDSQKRMLEALPKLVELLHSLTPAERGTVVEAAQDIVRVSDYRSMTDNDAMASVMESTYNG
jgi:hypothetical protein